MNTEVIATSYLKEIIATTDLLSPDYIKEGEKEPSWDGNLYLYSNVDKKKAGIKKIPVQVKGTAKESHPERITFRMGLDDMDNYLRDGGIILFVVYISKDGKRKRIYYESLLPIKIRVLKSRHAGKKKIPVECRPFPTDPEEMVSICMNFYEDMQKQRSFALSELKSIEELEEEGVLEGVAMSFVTFGKQKNDVKNYLLQNAPYMYAKIKGSVIPQPLELVPQSVHLEENVNYTISAGGKVFYQSARRIRSANQVEFCIGHSLRIIGEGQKLTFNYTPTSLLRDALIDTEFMIAFIENGELRLNDHFLPIEKINEEWADKLSILKSKLEYFQRVKAVLEFFGLDLDVNIQETRDSDIKNTDRLYRGLIKKEVVSNLKIDLPFVATVDYYGKKLILAFAKVDDSGSYNIYDFNSAPIWFAYNDGDKHFPTSRYVILKPDDFLSLANINLKKLIESYKELSDNENIFCDANATVLNLLAAYDKSGDTRTDVLSCAHDLAEWLVGLELSDDVLAMPIRKINLWQTLKRMGKLKEEDMKEALELAEDSSQEEIIRTGAFLLLDNTLAAEVHLAKVPEEQRKLLEDLPISRYWSKDSSKPV